MVTRVIEKVVRRMRGESQSTLIQDSQGQYAVAKLCGNPQGLRTLINECVTSALLKNLGLSTPDLQLLVLPEHLRTGGGLTFNVGRESWLPSKGVLHLGSACPVNPEKTAIFDFLPIGCAKKVINKQEFGAILVVDLWLSQLSSRQAIYARDHDYWSKPFRTYFIDHGQAFCGSQWRFERYVPSFNVSSISTLGQARFFEKFIERIEAIPEEELITAGDKLPECWFSKGERAAHRILLEELSRRRSQLHKLLRGLADLVVY